MKKGTKVATAAGAIGTVAYTRNGRALVMLADNAEWHDPKALEVLERPGELPGPVWAQLLIAGLAAWVIMGWVTADKTPAPQEPWERATQMEKDLAGDIYRACKAAGRGTLECSAFEVDTLSTMVMDREAGL